VTLGRQIARAEPERGLDRQQNQAEYGPGLGPVPHQPGGPGGAEGYDEEGDQEDDEGADRRSDRHRDLGTLLNHYIRPAEAIVNTTSRDLGL
jgi:hypothetical protein